MEKTKYTIKLESVVWEGLLAEMDNYPFSESNKTAMLVETFIVMIKQQLGSLEGKFIEIPMDFENLQFLMKVLVKIPRKHSKVIIYEINRQLSEQEQKIQEQIDEVDKKIEEKTEESVVKKDVILTETQETVEKEVAPEIETIADLVSFEAQKNTEPVAEELPHQTSVEGQA